ncbi:MAG: Hsp20/alpha crystallin family protein [Firmicutes bacterium]|nr:Hsp20/alpha crystallin family protein [Bacillota bacterium]
MEKKLQQKQLEMAELYQKKVKRRKNAARVPKIDFFESELACFIRISLPGVKDEDVSISFTDNNTLEIKGWVRPPEVKRGYNKVIAQEIFHGHFKRVFKLVTEVDTKSVRFENDNGILAVYIQKKSISAKG